jgi:hypothetical protein
LKLETNALLWHIIYKIDYQQKIQKIPFATICHQKWQKFLPTKSGPKKTPTESIRRDLFDFGLSIKNWKLEVYVKKIVSSLPPQTTRAKTPKKSGFRVRLFFQTRFWNFSTHNPILTPI